MRFIGFWAFKNIAPNGPGLWVRADLTNKTELLVKTKIMEKENRKQVSRPEPKPVLADGFGEDDYLEAVFLIEAKSFNTFFNRKMKLQEVTGFSDGCFDSYEEDEDGGCWKIITTAWFKNIDDLKKAIKSMKKYNWCYLNDSCIMLDGEYLFCDGRWIV